MPRWEGPFTIIEKETLRLRSIHPPPTLYSFFAKLSKHNAKEVLKFLLMMNIQ